MRLRQQFIAKRVSCFYFYAEERDEPAHVHVDKGGGTAKFWLDPLRLVWVDGLTLVEVRRARQIAARERAKLLEAWHEFFERKS